MPARHRDPDIPNLTKTFANRQSGGPMGQHTQTDPVGLGEWLLIVAREPSEGILPGE